MKFRVLISRLTSTDWWGCTCSPCLKLRSRYIPGRSHRQVKVVADICWGSTIERCLEALKQFFAAYSDSCSWGERSYRSVNSSFRQVNERLLIVCHLFDTLKCKTSRIRNDDYLWLCLVFHTLFLGAFAKVRVQVSPSVRMELRGSHWTDFHETWYSKTCLKRTPYIPETWTNGK